MMRISTALMPLFSIVCTLVSATEISPACKPSNVQNVQVRESSKGQLSVALKPSNEVDVVADTIIGRRWSNLTFEAQCRAFITSITLRTIGGCTVKVERKYHGFEVSTTIFQKSSSQCGLRTFQDSIYETQSPVALYEGDRPVQIRILVNSNTRCAGRCRVKVDRLPMAGYLPVMIIQAHDADECANQNNFCHAPEICQNTLGGFQCSSSPKPTSRAFASTSPTLRMTTGSITSTPWSGTLRTYLTSNKSSKLNTGSTSSTVLTYATEVPLITAFTQPSVQASALVPILIAIFAVLILLTCCCSVISFYLLRSGKILPYSTSNLVTYIRRVHSQGARPSERPAASNWDDGMRRESQLSNVSIRTTEATEEAVAYSASGPAGPVTSRRLSTKYRFEDSCASVSKTIGATEEVQTCSSTFQSTAKHADDLRGRSKMEGQQLKHDEVLIGGKAAQSPNKPPHLNISRVSLHTRNATVGHASAEKNESEDAVLDIYAMPMEKNPAYEMAMAKEVGATGNTEDGPASTMASTGESAALPGSDLPSKSTRVPRPAASTTQKVGHPDDVISSQPIYTAPDKLQFACKDASAGATGVGLGPQPAGTVIYDKVILKVNIGGNPSSADNINSALEPTIYAGVKNLSKARSE